MSLPDPVTEPAANYALIVAIESYRFKPKLNLDGPARDAIGWVGWLRSYEVPPRNIRLLANTLDGNEELFRQLDVECQIDIPIGFESLKETLREFQGKSGRLWVFWSGHGIMTPDGTRRPLLADYRDSDKSNLNVKSLMEHLRSTSLGYPNDQILVFDICATMFDSLEQRHTLPDLWFQTSQSAKNCLQFLMFASEDGREAINDTVRREGVFSRELRNVLSSSVVVHPNDLQSIHQRLLERFAELRRQNRNKGIQRPILWSWRDPSGNDDDNIELLPVDRRLYLSAVALVMAETPFDELLPRKGEDFFSDLHIQVRVGSRRNNPQKNIELIRLLTGGEGLPEDNHDEDRRRRAYRANADESWFADKVPGRAQPWFVPGSSRPSARLQFPWAVLLGDPGMGKTTLLRYEGWLTANEGIAALDSAGVNADELVVPIYARLADLADQPEVDFLLALAVAGAKSVMGPGLSPETLQDWLALKLKAGKVTVLLDGLDELTDEQYADIVKRLVQWIRSYRPWRLYLTSRTAGYKGLPPGMKQDGLPELELIAFTNDNITNYIRSFFGFSDSRAFDLLRQVSTAPELLGLMQTPLLLTLICLVFAEAGLGRSPQLPVTLGEVYARCLDGFLGKWRVIREHGYDQEISESEYVRLRLMRDFLSEFTWELCSLDPEHTLFTVEELYDALVRTPPESRSKVFTESPPAIVERLTRVEGILVRVGIGPHARYLYLHRTFQEFLLAWALSRRSDCLTQLKRHVYDPAWQVPLALLGDVWAIRSHEEGQKQNVNIKITECVRMLLEENAEDLLFRPLIVATRIGGGRERFLTSPTISGVVRRLISELFRDGSISPLIGRLLLAGQDRWESQLVIELIEAFIELVEDIGPNNLHWEVWDLIQTLGRVRRIGPEAVPTLIMALAHKSSLVRESAVEALGRLRQASPEALTALTQVLEGRHRIVLRMAEAIRRRGQVNSQEAIAMINALKETHTIARSFRLFEKGVRVKAAEALGLLGQASPTVVTGLIEAIDDPDAEVRVKAVEALGLLGQAGPQVVAALDKALHDEDSGLRVKAAEALGLLGQASPTLVTGLVEASDDPDAKVRIKAVEALRLLGQATPDVVAALTKALDDNDSRVRSEAVEALGLLGQATPDVVAALTKALDDEDFRVRLEAAESLSRQGQNSPKVLATLPQAVNNEDAHDWLKAAEALSPRVRTSHEVVAAEIKALKDTDMLVRSNAVDRLGFLGRTNPKAVTALIKALQHKDVCVRINAVSQLGFLGRTNPKAVAGLISAIDNANIIVRVNAVNQLGLLVRTSPGAVDGLIKAFEQSRYVELAVVAEVLCQVSQVSSKQLASLTAGLVHADRQFRKTAAGIVSDIAVRMKLKVPLTLCPPRVQQQHMLLQKDIEAIIFPHG